MCSTFILDLVILCFFINFYILCACGHHLMNVVFCICLLAQDTLIVASTDVSVSFMAMKVVYVTYWDMGGAE
mgnify:CR=1 FL=1